MDIQKEYEAELIFQVEPEKKKDNKNIKTRKIIKVATENLKKMVVHRLNGRAGDC